jgi:Flp pilus assembly protein TadG
MNRNKTRTLFRSTARWVAASGSQWPSKSRISGGQSATEFALMLPLVFIVLLVGVQYAVLGQAALALSQGASGLARYAAVNPGKVSNGNASALPSAAQQLLSPTILTNSGADLTVGVTSSPGTAFGDTCTVNLSYSATSKMVLPDNFFGIPLFPTTLSASAAHLYE